MLERLPKLKVDSKKLTQGIIGAQLIAVVGLTGFIFYKAQANSMNQQNGQVAGAVTQAYSIPPSMDITVGEATKTLQPADFDFHYVLTVQPTTQDKIKGKVKELIGRENPLNYIPQKLVFDEIKLQYWIEANFGYLEKTNAVSPEIIFAEAAETEEETPEAETKVKVIQECKKGFPKTKLPTQEILNSIAGYSQLPEELYFTLNHESLTEAQLKINDICDTITNFETSMRMVTIPVDNVSEPEADDAEAKEEKTDAIAQQPKAIDFLTKEEAKNIFEYSLDEETRLQIIIKNDAPLKAKLNEIKKLVDDEGEFNHKIINNSIIVFGEHRPSVLLDVDKSVEEFNKALAEAEELPKEFPLIISETNQLDGYNGVSIVTFPNYISYHSINIPVAPIERVSTIQQMLTPFEAITIEPNQEFSLNQILQAGGLASAENNILLEKDTNKIAYNNNIQVISTILYRMALESGFEITERLTEMKDVNANDFLDPYQYPITTSVATITKNAQPAPEPSDNAAQPTPPAEIENMVRDFKFKNNTDQPLLITLSYDLKENGVIEFYSKLYSKENYQPKHVELKNFNKHEITVGNLVGMNIDFVRVVNDKEEIFTTSFYK